MEFYSKEMWPESCQKLIKRDESKNKECKEDYAKFDDPIDAYAVVMCANPYIGAIPTGDKDKME